MAAAAPSATPAQSNTPSRPATRGDAQMVSMDISLRNWARGLRAPLWWFFDEMRASTSVSCVLVDAVLLGVGRGHHGEHGRRGEGAGGAVVGDGEGVEALVPGVLHLLDADGHGHVVGARGHRVGGGPQRLGPGGAVVLHPGDRLALELQGPGQGDAAHARLGGAEPVGVDVVLGHAGRGEGLARRPRRSGRRGPCPSARRSGVQPMPTMATRSLIPCDAMASPPRRRPLTPRARPARPGAPSRSSRGCRRR